MKKHIITKLRLGEISAVDKPAQPGATALLMKRAGATPDPAAPAPKETAMFKTREELLAAIAKALTTTPTDDERTNIVKSAEALGATDCVPVSVSKAAQPATDPALLARLEKSEKLGALSGAHRAHYDTLDTAGRDAFLAKADAARDQDIAKAAGDDPVVYTTLDGMDLRKSAGEALISMAKRSDQLAKDLAVEKASRTDEKLTKRAADEVGHLAGDVDTRKALLKAVDGITNEAVRTEVLKTLTAANTAMSGAFSKHGSKGGVDINKSGEVDITKAQAEDKLDELAKAYATANKVDFSKAYSAVLDTEEGRKLYAAAA